MYGAWGSRTEDGRLYTARNLDWLANSGISEYKLLSVYHTTGKIPYVTIGFAGMVGALTVCLFLSKLLFIFFHSLTNSIKGNERSWNYGTFD